MKNNIFIEYDNPNLKTLSNELYNLFKNNGYDTTLLDNTISINEKMGIINNKPNSFIISNKLNNESNSSIEIIYPLRDDDNLPKSLNDNLSKNITVSKYYQLRDSINTILDYYEILRDINKNDGIVIKYGESILNNSLIPITIYQTISKFLNKENIYIVKSGDSLYAIARRFNTTVDSIKNINNLTSNNLSIGQKLIIPTTNNQNNSENIYTVKSGDSLYAIARRFNTTVDSIKNINNLTSNNLSIGQKLIIPTTNNQNNSENIYTVKSGDSLYAIARRFNTTVDSIKNINNLTSNNLSIGQKLIIP